MEKTAVKIEYIGPSIEAIEIMLEGSILIGSGTAGGDAGGEDGWD